jgi:transposase-like protein
MADDYRKSGVLLGLESRGFTMAPKLATGDGAMGFWVAMEEVYPSTRHQRCWLHKTLNVLNYLPRNLRGQARDKMHQITMAENREGTVEALELFVQAYQAKYPKAAECLTEDRETLLAFYDLSAKHWTHPDSHRDTSNPIESMFSTIRLRHNKTRNPGAPGPKCPEKLSTA